MDDPTSYCHIILSASSPLCLAFGSVPMKFDDMESKRILSPFNIIVSSKPFVHNAEKKGNKDISSEPWQLRSILDGMCDQANMTPILNGN